MEKQVGLEEAGKERPRISSEQSLGLICKPNYYNTLPDLPFDVKRVSYSLDPLRFVTYNVKHVDKYHQHEMHPELNVEVPIELVCPEVNTENADVQLDPADELLMEDDCVVISPQSKRSERHARYVPWLRRTEYISTEQIRFQSQNLDKVGYKIEKKLVERMLYLSRDLQIIAVAKTFEDARVPIERHYSKPNVFPVEILPVFPDFKLWKYRFAQVSFDTNPALIGKSNSAQIEEMSEAMIRCVINEQGQQFVAYFLPSEDTLVKRRADLFKRERDEDGELYEYRMAGQYNWSLQVKHVNSNEENYFLVVRPNGIYYNELETKVRLNKRRVKMGQEGSTLLTVTHRPMNATELWFQNAREKQLQRENDEEYEIEVDDSQKETEYEEEKQEEVNETNGNISNYY